MNLIFIFILSTVCRTEMKGWELYSFLKNKEVRYVLVVGTNRLKSEGEIIDHNGSMDLTELSKKLKKLDKNEHVIIEGGGLQAESSKLILPPETDRKEILWICHSQELKCRITE